MILQIVASGVGLSLGVVAGCACWVLAIMAVGEYFCPIQQRVEKLRHK